MIADDHAVVHEGLTAILSGQPDIILVGAAANDSEALALVQDTQPDVVLLDLAMPAFCKNTTTCYDKAQHNSGAVSDDSWFPVLVLPE